jgi:XTP/dITP diphosphohydrolase
MISIVCATANAGKVAELSALLQGVVHFLPRPADVGEVIEDAHTVEGNARLKAVAICSATGLPALADDTALEVDALGGEPGVFTARFAGPNATDEQNKTLLLQRLEGVPDEQRQARFRTVIVVRWPNGRELVTQGVCEGRISTVQRGERGFGYDAVFIPAEGQGRTFAEMSNHDKNALSHRGRAVVALAQRLHGGAGGGS